MSEVCFSCGTPINEVHGFPMEAIEFKSWGNYGSTVFDSVAMREYMRILICDDCVRANPDRVAMWQEKPVGRVERTRIGTYSEWREKESPK